MKKICTILFILMLSIKINAQWVTIPDPNFVTYLQQNYPACMNGNQMDTTCSAIVNEWNLTLNNQNISNIDGVQYFKNIWRLWCHKNNISSIYVNLPPYLTELALNENPISIIPSLPNLIKILAVGGGYYVPSNGNITFSSPLPNSLETLMIFYSQTTTLPSLPTNLKGLICNNNQLTSLPSLPNSLTSIECNNNQLTSLPALPPNLGILKCDNNLLTSLPNLPNSLNNIQLNNNSLINLPTLPDTLSYLYVHNNPLTCLPQLKTINNLIFTNTNVQCVPNYGNVINSNPLLTSLPICDFYNGNSCFVYQNINGRIYNDNNANCVNDTNEIGYKNFKIDLYNNGNFVSSAISNIEGYYTITADTGTYIVTIDTVGLPISINCPASGFYTSVLTLADSIDFNLDFAVECTNGFDIGVQSVTRTSGQFFPANYATIKVDAGDLANFYGLNCALGVSGTVTININGPVTYISEVPGALAPNVSGNTILTYNISDFGTVNFNSDFRFIVQTDTFAQGGSIICVIVNVTPTAGDNDTLNNVLQHCFTVVNSFDPNEKEVYPEGNLEQGHEWLTYTIRFQNTGTAPAQHLYILDTLDANLDVSTFTLLSYSHDNLTQVLGDVVKFNFPNINLPDSTNDEPNSHGYVQYKIKLKPNLPIGTVISNTAYNFFDFNPPIATNTVQNQIYFLSPTITPNNLILCPNESDTLWTQVYDNYQWFKDGNLIPGANNQLLVVDYFNDSGSQFMVEVDSAGVIAQSPPVLVDGWAFLPPFVITEGTFTIGSMGEVILCPGDTVYLILGQPYDTNIQWTDNGAPITGANDDTLIVTQAGLYHVTGEPSQCPNYVQGLFTDIEVVMSPPLSPSITPNSLILCPNESDTLWTQQFGTYQWYKDGTLIPGATNQFLVVDAFNDAGSQFSVVVSQGNCTGSSSQVLVDGWVFLLPYVISEGTFTVGPNGEMLMCPGDTAYLILGQPYDTNIQWTESGNIISGATNDTLVVTQSGMYHVSGAPSTCPNYIQNLGVTIEVIVQGPAEPVIILSGNNLQTQSGYTYQWYYNGNPVGTNSNILALQGQGTYTLTITDAQGCTAESAPFVVTGVLENSVSGVVNVNYNSQTGTLHIFRSETKAETEIFVVDVLGRVIADEKMLKGTSEIEIKLTHIKPGIYFVNLSEGSSVKFFVE